MFDIHCHLIPGIDDGARDKDEALSLLRLAVDDGITHMVLTPHMHLGRFDNSKNDIFDAFMDLKLAVAEQQIPIELAFGAEVRIDAELLYLFEKGKIPFVGEHNKTKVVLLELPHSHVPPGADKLIKWMINHNITPIIAHPERNRDIQKKPELALMLKRIGCLLQVTAASITGDFGEKAKLCSDYLLNKGCVDFVASDAHNLKRRPPILSNAFKTIEQHHGTELANALFINNAKSITNKMFLC